MEEALYKENKTLAGNDVSSARNSCNTCFAEASALFTQTK